MIEHLVMYSGGLCSFFAAKRVVERHGKSGVKLLFADTLIEDEDLYRFVDETVEYLDVELIRIADGRTPWEVCKDVKFIASSRIDPCSRVLKRDLLNKWRDDNCDPATTTVHFGIDWTETHRLDRLRKRDEKWNFQAYMTEEPFLSKQDMMDASEELGIKVPRLYKLGFAHNNCGGFCYKAGQAQFQRLLKTMPERYKFHEEQEKKLAQELEPIRKKPISILQRQEDGEKKNLTLEQFRIELERQPDLFDEFDWGGCGCAVD